MEIALAEKAPEAITIENISQELKLDEGNSEVAVITQENPEIIKKADDLIKSLLALTDKDLREKQKFSDAIQTIGAPIQQKLAQQSKLLKAPMAALIQDANDGGLVANGLLSLQENVNEINPNRVDFSMGTVRRLLSKIPGFGTPISKWFAKYQAVDSVINDVVKSLEDGKGQLQRDNTTLRDDQIRMRELTFQLEDYIKLAQVMDIKLEEVIKALPAGEDVKRKFLEEELLFSLKQRIIDLQQQRAVNQQGVVATEVILRNNRELINGVNRALNVTVTALNTAATLQIALQRQRKVLEGVQAVTKTTNDLIAGTAEQLKTQGTQIQQQATEATLDIETLKKAFADVDTALNDISQFRRNALPQMATSIKELDDMTGKMEKAITSMEKGNQVSDTFSITLNNEA
ncbi:MAG: hypothetical protein ACJAYK_000146 [Crocinitomicaceae bacterium]|jgi:uncharacterized protein YaaN involved in tellurite resistance